MVTHVLVVAVVLCWALYQSQHLDNSEFWEIANIHVHIEKHLYTSITAKWGRKGNMYIAGHSHWPCSISSGSKVNAIYTIDTCTCIAWTPHLFREDSFNFKGSEVPLASAVNRKSPTDRNTYMYISSQYLYCRHQTFTWCSFSYRTGLIFTLHRTV